MPEDYDSDFYEYVYDNDGKAVLIKKHQISKSEKLSGFTTYDSSHGHCGLCGELGCNGRCFR